MDNTRDRATDYDTIVFLRQELIIKENEIAHKELIIESIRSQLHRAKTDLWKEQRATNARFETMKLQLEKCIETRKKELESADGRDRDKNVL